ncbi:MAG: PorP/SprF family type IX secretion system membrane protein [Bacteroidales bacterium]|nr:PorP/SprF family type IX secretion system membrane protein [Bacteroidales bacterium]
MRYKTYIFTVLFLIFTINGRCQDRAILNSQYQFNGLVINPAYAGRNEVFTFLFSHRNQWMGFEGAPKAYTLSLHWPMKNIKTALGILGYQEEIGSRKYSSVYFNYAHRITLGNGRLSMGLRGGIASGRFDMIDLGNGEFVFDDKLQNFLLPNFGLGVFYYTQNLFAGISIPLLLGYKVTDEPAGLQVYHDFSNYGYCLTAGYSFPINNTLRLQPSTLIRYQKSYSFTPDLNINLIYKDNFMGGLSYRPNEAFIFLFNWKFNYQSRLGVSYDFGLGDLSNYHNGSLEFTFQYEFGYKIRVSDPGNF